jgi:para-aminobenzoate synthetase
MGCPSGPLWRRITYRLPPLQQQQQQRQLSSHHQQQRPGTLTVAAADGRSSSAALSVFDYLEDQLALMALRGCSSSGSSSVDSSSAGSSGADGLREAAEQLPFDFWGGFVGYLGYELKSECGGAAAHAASTPDAAWLFADRVVAIDHKGSGGRGDVYLLALYDDGAAAVAVSDAVAGAAAGDEADPAAAAAARWIQDTERLVGRLAAAHGSGGGAPPAALSGKGPHHLQQHQQTPQPQPQPFTLRDPRPRYVSSVAACQSALAAGESYELCLTTALRRAGPLPHPWRFYTTLRAVNPAPYGAWLRFTVDSDSSADGGAGAHADDTCSGGTDTGRRRHNGTGRSTVTICCSSPERFLRGGRGGLLEARPIKGTARRAADPIADAALAAALASCEKERAENLMIVDLLRNDLGRVCEPGSVHVPGLIELESYATVHQLVSTVRGLRRGNVSCVAAARAAFPGGSMTGAPKVRSMEILDKLEAAPRGVYSGALGFFSVNGTFDLNIVIRTAVFEETAVENGGEGAGADAAAAEEQQEASLLAGAPAVKAGAAMRGGGVEAASSTVTVGAGGAVVVQSEPEAEYDEMRLKAAALLRAFELAEGRPSGSVAAAVVGAGEEEEQTGAAARAVVVVGEVVGKGGGKEPKQQQEQLCAKVLAAF